MNSTLIANRSGRDVPCGTKKRIEQLHDICEYIMGTVKTPNMGCQHGGS